MKEKPGCQCRKSGMSNWKYMVEYDNYYKIQRDKDKKVIASILWKSEWNYCPYCGKPKVCFPWAKNEK
jgi:hypothetical protein